MIRPPPRSTPFPTRRSSDLRLAEPAQRGDLDHLGKRAHALALDGPVEHPQEPRGPLPARRALPEAIRSAEHTSELQSRPHIVCRLLLAKQTAVPRPCLLVPM